MMLCSSFAHAEVLAAFGPLPAKVQSARDDIVQYFGEEPQEEIVRNYTSYVTYNLYFKAPNGKLQFASVIFHLVQQDRVFTVMALNEPFLRNFNDEVPVER